MRFVQPLPVMTCFILALGVSPAEAQRARKNPPRDRSSAIERFEATHPGARRLTVGDLTRRIYGQAFEHGENPEDTAERFVQRHSAVFAVPVADLDPRGPLFDARHTQAVVVDPDTGAAKFTLVYYTQRRAGVPVFRADLRLLVRNVPGYPLVLAASSLRDLGDFQPPRQAAAATDDLLLAAARLEAPGVLRVRPAEPVIWAGVDDDTVPARAGVQFIAEEAFQRWLMVADATTAAILYKEPLLIDVDVSGTVQALVTEGSGSEQCEAEVLTPLPYLRVNVQGGNAAFTSLTGAYTIPNFSTTPLTVQSPLIGQWFEVTNFGGPDALLETVVTPPGPADFTHNPANGALTRAEVNAYVGSNQVRDFAVGFNPTYPTLMNTGFPVNVNRTDNVCPQNAWYDSFAQTLNFCQEGGGSPNTAWSSVIYHEYGHHLVAAGGSGQGQYGEGMGDVMSVLLLDEAEVGIGFFGSCSPNASLRDADNAIQYPCTGAIHTCGQLIAGCVWELRNELLATNPATYIAIAGNLAVNSILLHSGTTIDPSITIDYLTLDDNDNNINNGTPHSSEICTGFGAHNMDCPPLDAIGFSYPNGLPTELVPDTATTIAVNVVPVSGSPVANSGAVSYRIGGGAFTTVPMTELTPNQYEATLPGVPCSATIEFYFSADATGVGTLFDPSSAPTASYSAISAVEFVEAVAYDFETNPSWTVSNSGLTDGAWTRGVPVGGGDRGDPPTDYDGSGACWLTDNVDGNSDVDGGTTTLVSNVLNLSSLSDPFLSYARWYSNTSGSAPEADIFVVEITANGSTWVPVETVGPTGAEVNGGWFTRTWRVSDFITPTSTVQVRFSASDLGAGSVVEAGVDAFSITDLTCDPCEEPCDDGNACTINDACAGVVCVGTPVDCSGLGDQCNTAGCDLAGAEGNCDLLIPVANGTACDDGQACTTADVCSAGSCAGTVTDCSGAGDQCNTASCDPGGAAGNCAIITPLANGSACDDSDPCNVGESCQTGACSGGSSQDCSASDTECALAGCDAGGAEGNCDTFTPVLDGTACDSGLGVCQAGACVPDPGDNAVFLVAAGGTVPASPGGPTSLTMLPGSTLTVEVWAADTAPQTLGSYQIALPGSATPTGGSGTLDYVGGSVAIDSGNAEWVFFGDPADVFFSEVGLPTGFAMIAALPLGLGEVVDGSTYLGQFQLQASPDACGIFSYSFLPDGAPPNGGSALVDETAGLIAAVYQSLQIDVAPPNDACADATPLTGNAVSANFSTSCATQDGPTHGCGDIAGDVWFEYTASCTGQLTVSTTDNCTIDTAVAVYNGGVGCTPGAGDLQTCGNTVGDCESVAVAVTSGASYLIRVGSVVGAAGSGTLTLTCDGPCLTATECGDADDNAVTDDQCMFYSCDGACNAIPRTFADAGGSFGACPTDGFVNIHDRNHVFLCFAATNSCDAINHDLGGAFGACPADGFCNVHDANHVNTTFAGTNTCACPMGPAPEVPPTVAGRTDVVLTTAAERVRPGDTVEVAVVLGGALDDLQSYQIALLATGGERGHLDLLDIRIDDRRDVALDPLGRFEAHNLGTAQMLAGHPDSGQATGDTAYLATFVYRASKGAHGTFVVDLDAVHTALIATGNGMIVFDSAPLVIEVAGERPRTSRR